VTRDPYKYFRVEARELVEGLSRGVLDFEKGVAPADASAGLLRLAHTLKGAARVVREAKIAETAHAIEDILGPYRDGSLVGDRALRPEDAQRLLALLDSISSAVAALEPSPAKAPDSPGPPTSSAAAPVEALRSVRVEIEEMDALLGGLFEASVQLSALRKRMEALGTVVDLTRGLSALLPREGRERTAIDEILTQVGRAERSLASGLDRVENELGDAQDKAQKLRLVPASTIFATLERAVRDAAQALKKEVQFEARGGECRVEANVLFAIRDALIHVVRNAVAHGIEAPGERARLRKPAMGKVQLGVERRGQRIAFVCKDDGKGIDVDTVVRAAASRATGGPVAASPIPREQALRLVLESGVTTAESVTGVSGRGVGLDILRKTALDLNGEIALESEPGRGTTVDVCVPLSVSSIVTLVFEVAGLTLSLPLDAVERTMNIGAGTVVRSAQQDVVIVGDTRLVLLSAASLAAELGQPATASERASLSAAIVVQAGSRSAAIEIDRLIGTSMTVLRPLPPLSGSSPLVSGASLDAEGHPKLILDARGLVDAAHRTRTTSRAMEAPSPRAPILVVDDSLTTRMLEQSILESAGYAVELATSAEQAEAKARESAYSLFLVDVEMPGMDGFEFVSRTRADPQTRAIPAILVTSRDAPEDRRRGAEVGASGYVVKGEFDQGHLLGTIRQLIG
jgi:two-component system chemotaxis sensor kinase CheA